MAHIGSWDWNILTGEVYWSDELFRIFGILPQKPGLSYDKALKYIHPKDRACVNNAIKRAFNGELFEIDYRTYSLDGTAQIVHAQGEVIFDNKNTLSG